MDVIVYAGPQSHRSLGSIFATATPAASLAAASLAAASLTLAAASLTLAPLYGPRSSLLVNGIVDMNGIPCLSYHDANRMIGFIDERIPYRFRKTQTVYEGSNNPNRGDGARIGCKRAGKA